MKRYNAPEIEICAFRAEDIMDTSGGTTEGVLKTYNAPETAFDGTLKTFGD